MISPDSKYEPANNNATNDMIRTVVRSYSKKQLFPTSPDLLDALSRFPVPKRKISTTLLMMADEIPIYFETSWSILSSIGLINVLIGILVVGITSLSPITIVPIVVSAASAIADGLCYYAFYANHAKTPTAIAAAFADVFWMVCLLDLLYSTR